MRTAFGDVHLRPDEAGSVGFFLDAITTPEMTVTRWAMTGISGGTLEPDAPGTPTFLTGIRLGGEFRMWSPAGQLDCTRPFLYPDPTDSEVETPAAATLAITRSTIDRYSRQLTDSSDFRIRFLDTSPIDQHRDTLWRTTMTYTARTLHGLLGAPEPQLVLAHLTDHATRMLLNTFPNTALEHARSRTRVYGTAVTQATTFIDDHLAEPITVTDIAVAAGLSRRGLYAAFERELDTAPMQYLKQARLSAAHADLLNADPLQTTVTATATRWGFASPAAFAQAYRRTYGQTPRHTLES